MSLLLLILIPLATGIISFFAGNSASKGLAAISALATLIISIMLCGEETAPQVVYEWIPTIGAQISLFGDPMALSMCVLTSLVFLTTIIFNWHKNYTNTAQFFALMQLAQVGLTGVFLATDMLLFYLFWEVALIPVYFLCSIYGGEKRIAVTFKFFVYTFLGSLLMLGSIIYLASLSGATNSFSWENIIASGMSLDADQQMKTFWILFLAFAIKMPMFPLHTWQPDAYQQSPTPVTIVLSALMVKMGIYGIIRWVVPVLPLGMAYWSTTIAILSVIGIVYASLVAWRQDNIKKLVAYSSIAHMGLMIIAVAANTSQALHGVFVQMFNHGVTIAALWLIVDFIEQRYGTQKISELGGMAKTAPMATIALVIIAFANISLPLTNGFIGEFMLFHGIFQSTASWHIWIMVLAGTGIILGAMYTLNMVQKVAYGEPKGSGQVQDLKMHEAIGVAILVALILVLGIYPKPLVEFTQGMF